MIKTIFLANILMLLLSGCSGGLLPSIKQTTKSPWQHFEEAKKSFDIIAAHQTTSEDLKQLGFDPFETPNVKLCWILNAMAMPFLICLISDVNKLQRVGNLMPSLS